MRTIDFFTLVNMPNRLGQEIKASGHPVRIRLPSGEMMILMDEQQYETVYRMALRQDDEGRQPDDESSPEET